MAIKIMGPNLSNKIAAGEVVERPRSIVKELVENALDAGATEVKIAIKQSGIQEIIIEDNGRGMDKEDALLAFQRHATSKIFTEADLFSIHTLGFRGEALAAIASVSKVQMLTGQTGAAATYVEIHGGKVLEHTSKNTYQGTKITVSQLFYNTPARLKHLKSLQTEYVHILEYLQKMAIARPDVRFEFSSDGKEVFRTYGTNRVADTLVMIYGDRIANFMYPVYSADNDFKVEGIITHPQMQRTNQRVINLSINKRTVRHFGINKAILSGYGTLIPRGSYPIVALNIEVDTKLVDVNVHPAKLEVRISQERQLELLITQMVREALTSHNLLYQNVTMPTKIRTTEQNELQFSNDYKPTQKPAKEYLQQAQKIYTLPENTIEQFAKPLEEVVAHWTVIAENSQDSVRKNLSTANDVTNNIQNTEIDNSNIRDKVDKSGLSLETADQVLTNTSINETMPMAAPTPAPSETDAIFCEAKSEIKALEVIGQFNATYILAQKNATFYIVDQHAAQERIKYDQHMVRVRNANVTTQQLLFPLVIFLEARDLQLVTNAEAEIARQGIEFELFSDREIRINSVPIGIKQDDIEKYVRNVIDCLVKYDTVDTAIVREKELIMLSCKYSIKAHDVLNKEEMESLLIQLSETETPFTCPHGRPIVVKYSLYEIERWFKRV